MAKLEVWKLADKLGPLKKVNFCLSSRKAIILTTGIHWVFWGLKFESDTEIGQKGTFCKGLMLAYHVYKATQNFPKEEIYGLASRVRRAALSVPTNIVERYSRKGDKELTRFISISLGSLAETKYLIYFSHRLEYLSDNEYDKINKGYDKKFINI